jgi:hypothetical protein
MRDGENMHFIFLMDRSGSMEPDLKKCKEMLKLYISALPVGSSFSIISFGKDFTRELLNCEYENGIFPIVKEKHHRYKKALDKFITEMTMNYKGTHLVGPLQECANIHRDAAKQGKTATRIIIVTDGVFAKDTINQICDAAGSLPTIGDINVNLIGIADNPEEIEHSNI